MTPNTDRPTPRDLIEAPATEGGWNLNSPDDTAIVFLEDYAGRMPLDVYEDLQADIAQLVTDEREWRVTAGDEGRQEAVRLLRGHRWSHVPNTANDWKCECGWFGNHGWRGWAEHIGAELAGLNASVARHGRSSDPEPAPDPPRPLRPGKDYDNWLMGYDAGWRACLMASPEDRSLSMEGGRLGTPSRAVPALQAAGEPPDDPEFGPHAPGCDGKCANRAGSEQCFA